MELLQIIPYPQAAVDEHGVVFFKLPLNLTYILISRNE